jgi:zinc finger MYND domain-containing protein 10
MLYVGKWQKLNDFRWEDVQPIDLLKITKLEGQPWISLYHLMAKQVFRERYHINTFRKGQVSVQIFCIS